MGMAASQARLLTITSRMHDVEYQAQSIQNAKIALATQQDQVYQDYLDALDATTLTVKNYKGEVTTANFNTLCGINAVRASKLERYVLRNDKNKIIVDNEIAKGYEDFKQLGVEQNAYMFAMYMLSGGDPDFDSGKKDINGEEKDISKYNEAIREIFTQKVAEDKLPTSLKDIKKQIEEWIAKAGEYDENAKACMTASDLYEKIATLKEAYASGLGTDPDKEYGKYQREEAEKIQELIDNIDAAYEKLTYQVYTSYSEEIYEKAEGDDFFDEDDFWYYVNMYKQIEANGGAYIEISEYNGLEGVGNAATDSDWLQDMIKAGKITIDISSINQKTGELSFSSTGVSSDTYLEYTTTSSIDKKALAKAEAEYEHKTKQLSQKDKKFDMDLSKLETERSALKTEYDSVKKVVEDNIERTFGIFS